MSADVMLVESARNIRVCVGHALASIVKSTPSHDYVCNQFTVRARHRRKNIPRIERPAAYSNSLRLQRAVFVATPNKAGAP